jgi:hypothetical protein
MMQTNYLSQQATRFWVKNQPKTLFLAILAGLLIYLHTLPYFNFLLAPAWSFLLFWLVTLYLFRLQGRASVVVGISGLLLSGFATILLKVDVARNAADFAYYVIIIAFVQYLLEARHAKR